MAYFTDMSPMIDAHGPWNKEMKLTVVLAVVVGTLVLACSSAAPALVEPTPNIDATVEAKLAQKRAVDATVQAILQSSEQSISFPVEADPNQNLGIDSSVANDGLPNGTASPLAIAPNLFDTTESDEVDDSLIVEPSNDSSSIRGPEPSLPTLQVNGTHLPILQPCSRVEGGEFCVYPVSKNAGSFPKGTTVYIAAFPDVRDSVVTWEGTNENYGKIVSVDMTRNRAVTLNIKDPAANANFLNLTMLLNQPYFDPNGVEVVLTDMKIDSSPSRTNIDITYTLKNQTTEIQPIFPWTVYLASRGSIPKYLSPNCFIHPGQYKNHTWRFEIPGGEIPVRLGYPGRLHGGTWQRGDLLWEIQTGDRGSQSVIAYPQAISYDEPLQITLFGFRQGIKLDPDSVSCDGVDLPIPGYYGVPGDIPQSNDDGVVRFNTQLSASDIKIGLVSLDVERRPFYSASTLINFEGALLDTLPIAGEFTFNRPVILTGSKYSSTNSNSSKPYMIDGTKGSGIRVDGKLLGEIYVEYPILLSDSGNFITQITLPGIERTIASSTILVEVEDSVGRLGQTNISVDSASVAIHESLICAGLDFEIRGEGFWASNEALGVKNSVELEFATISTSSGGRIPTVSYIGRVEIDQFGRFTAESIVPGRTRPGTVIEIWAKPEYGEDVKESFWVPGPQLNVSPVTGLVGQQISVAITGLPSYYTLPPSSLKIEGTRIALPGYLGSHGKEPVTDRCGAVTVTTEIPVLSSGLKLITFDLPGGGELISPFSIRNAKARVTPNEVILGQTVGFLTRELSPKPHSRSPRLISGLHDSIVFVGTASQDLPTPHVIDTPLASDNASTKSLERYSLKVNGKPFPMNQSCMPIQVNLWNSEEAITNEICVFPLAKQSGKFAESTEVTLGLIENYVGYKYQWAGVKVSLGSIVSIVIDEDTEISVTMLPSEGNIIDIPSIPATPSGQSDNVRVLGIPYEYIDGTKVTLTAYSKTFNYSTTRISFSYKIENPTHLPQKSLRWKLYSEEGSWIIEKGLFCEILPGGYKEVDVHFTFDPRLFTPHVLAYPGEIFSDNWSPTDLVWELKDLQFGKDYATEEVLESGLNLGEPYLSADGIEVTLKSIGIEPYGRGSMIAISYRLWNKGEDSKQAKGWKVYYEGGGGIDQLGIFDKLAFGHVSDNTYKFYVPPGKRPNAIVYPGRLFEDVWKPGDLVWFIENFQDNEISIPNFENINLDSQHVPYPVTVGRDGVAFFPVTFPYANAIVNKDFLAIYATDTGGRTAVGEISIISPTIVLSTDMGIKGSLITLTGEGFINGKDHFGRKYFIDIFYGVERFTKNRTSRRNLDSLIPVKTIIPNALGGFKTSFSVPSDALADSMNSIIAKVREFDIQARAFHEIPDTELTLSPRVISAGKEVTISGTGFPNSVPILKILIGRVNVNFGSVKTDNFGNFTVHFQLPDSLPSGTQRLVVSTRSFSKIEDIKVR